MKASDLIKKSIQSAHSLVPEPALAELRKLCDHNDSLDRMTGRVHASRAVELLQSYGVKVGGRVKLDRICREHLNRRSYGTK